MLGPMIKSFAHRRTESLHRGTNSKAFLDRDPVKDRDPADFERITKLRWVHWLRDDLKEGLQSLNAYNVDINGEECFGEQ